MEYDTAGRPSAICNGPCANNDPYVDSFSFGAYGLPLSSTLGNGVPETIGYNNLLQITSIQAGSSGSLFDLANGYSSGSNNGNIVSQTINGSVSRSFLYDGLNRLTEAAQSSSWTEGYSYDRFGNRAVTTRTSPLPGLTGETPDQLTDYNTSNNRISVFTYDARGNIAATPAWTANYDGENRQESVMRTGGSWTWYGYDASNRRIVKTDGTNGTLYFYDAFGRLAAEDDGTTTIEYIAGSKVVENSSTGRQYYTKDHLGSTRLITDGSGTPVSTHDYLPFGEELGGSGCATLDGGAKFTGQYRDEESCLDYFVNRYVSSAQGRFTSPDLPFIGQQAGNPQSWNLYVYVTNNPLTYVDSSGHYPELGSIACQFDPYACANGFNPSSCYLDGFQTDCGQIALLGFSGAVVGCPNNICRGVNEYNLPVQYHATDDGNYYAPTLPGVWSSANDAGMVAAGSMNPQSIATNAEIGGNIYQLPNGQFSWNVTVYAPPGAPGFVTDPSVPAGTINMGDFHTHGTGRGYEQFSYTDHDNMTQKPSYLGTPERRIVTFQPDLQGTYPNGCVMNGLAVPSDPNNMNGPTPVPTCGASVPVSRRLR